MSENLMPRWLQRLALYIVAASLSAATAAAAPSALSREAVARALPGIAADHIILLAPVMVRSPHPTFEIVRIIRRSDINYLRLRCRPALDCMPFYVAVDAPLPVALRHNTDRTGVEEPDLVRAGTRALFMVEQGPFRLSVPVICLQTGRFGQIIRVRTERNRILRGEIIGIGLIRGGAGELQ